MVLFSILFKKIVKLIFAFSRRLLYMLRSDLFSLIRKIQAYISLL
jgi:hypothetical protein